MNIRPLALAVFLLVAPLSAPAQTPLSDVKAGDAALDHNNYQGAFTRFDRAVRASPHNRRLLGAAFHGRGEARLQLHEWSEAKDDLSRAIALNPNDAGAFAARGMARKGLGDYDGLLLDARQAATLSPTHFAGFEDDAKSTVLYRRMMLVFLGLAGILLVVGAVPLVRILARLIRAGV